MSIKWNTFHMQVLIKSSIVGDGSKRNCDYYFDFKTKTIGNAYDTGVLVVSTGFSTHSFMTFKFC